MVGLRRYLAADPLLEKLDDGEAAYALATSGQKRAKSLLPKVLVPLVVCVPVLLLLSGGRLDVGTVLERFRGCFKVWLSIVCGYVR